MLRRGHIFSWDLLFLLQYSVHSGKTTESTGILYCYAGRILEVGRISILLLLLLLLPNLSLWINVYIYVNNYLISSQSVKSVISCILEVKGWCLQNTSCQNCLYTMLNSCELNHSPYTIVLTSLMVYHKLVTVAWSIQFSLSPMNFPNLYHHQVQINCQGLLCQICFIEITMPCVHWIFSFPHLCILQSTLAIKSCIDDTF